MDTSHATPPTTGRRPSSAVAWRVAAAVSVLAVAVHLWGLYRVAPPPSVSWFPHSDKLEHLVGFAFPVVVILLTLRLRRRAYDAPPLGARTVAAVAGVFGLHAIVSELIQASFYTTRSGDPYDALADACGVLLGLAIFWLAWWRADRAQLGAG